VQKNNRLWGKEAKVTAPKFKKDVGKKSVKCTVRRKGDTGGFFCAKVRPRRGLWLYAVGEGKEEKNALKGGKTNSFTKGESSGGQGRRHRTKRSCGRERTTRREAIR